MKPRNRFEKAVLAESKKLRPISKTQCKWAFREREFDIRKLF